MLLGVTTEDFIPSDHPIRRVRGLIDEVLLALSPQLTAMYAPSGRRSIPPEHLIKATLLMALYSIRSERQFCERLQYDLLFKWFLGLNITDAAFDHSSFSKNRQRLLQHDLAQGLLGEVVREARQRRLISEDHFSIDGTLLQAWASQKSVRPRDEQDPPTGDGGRNQGVDFHGQRRTNETHVSTTDPEAMLARKGRGQESRLAYAGHVLMENRNGIILDLLVTQATGTAERDAAIQLLDRRRLPRKRMTLAGDKGYEPGPSPRRYANAKSHRMSPRIRPTAGAQSTGGRPGMPAMRSVNGCASASKNASAGSRQPAKDASSGTSAKPRTSSGQPSPPSPLTSSAWQTWRPRQPNQQTAKIRTAGPASHPDKARRRYLPPLGPHSLSSPSPRAASGHHP